MSPISPIVLDFITADLVRLPFAFDHDDFIFELKLDGFRAVAISGEGQTRLVSRRGKVYKRFTELAAAIHLELDRDAVLDGEIVCLDENGRPQFLDLLRQRRQPVFYAFDLLSLDGQDLRMSPLVERKKMLRSIIPPQPSVMLYAQEVERDGRDFFRLACDRDLEGVVAKYKFGMYGERWFKIRNPGYSQCEGRKRAGSSR
jgi:bifunctional non-homologous end joining protein LigD